MMMSRSSAQRVVDPPAKVQKARDARGHPPLYKFTVVEVPSSGAARGGGLGGVVRASPMLHWRRGHYRTLPDERVIPVAPALVGTVERGILAKLYDGTAAHARPLPFAARRLDMTGHKGVS